MASSSSTAGPFRLVHLHPPFAKTYTHLDGRDLEHAKLLPCITKLRRTLENGDINPRDINVKAYCRDILVRMHSLVPAHMRAAWQNSGLEMLPDSHMPRWHSNGVNYQDVSCCVELSLASSLSSSPSYAFLGGKRAWAGQYIKLTLGYDAENKPVRDYAHRLSKALADGMPDDMSIKWECMHLCHNKRCVNPWHLEWGTSKENKGLGKKKAELLKEKKHNTVVTKAGIEFHVCRFKRMKKA
jgi:hypothetical protein